MSVAGDFGTLYSDCHAVGGMSAYAYEDDPKRLTFTLARYKHTAKLLEGRGWGLEVGCADGYGSRIVRQHLTGGLVACDLDAKSIDEARGRRSANWPIIFVCGDLSEARRVRPLYDAVYCLDVLEHVPPEAEDEFLRGLAAVAPVAVVGTPSLESQVYASRLSKEGHVNCKTGPDLKRSLQRHWKQVFLFSMNDEAIGTGFSPMAHYRLALCVQ